VKRSNSLTKAVVDYKYKDSSTLVHSDSLVLCNSNISWSSAGATRDPGRLHCIFGVSAGRGSRANSTNGTWVWEAKRKAQAAERNILTPKRKVVSGVLVAELQSCRAFPLCDVIRFGGPIAPFKYSDVVQIRVLCQSALILGRCRF